MRTLQADLQRAVEHLPAAAVLALEGVSWEEYEQVLEDFSERPGVRITYNCGRLELVTTSPGHEAAKEFIHSLARILCEEWGLQMESFGAFTWKRKRDLKGAEADTCFYIASADRVMGKVEIDLNQDPPPDIVVEIDKASQSVNKFSIYATFGVPEIWRCDIRRGRIEILELRGESYVEVASSRFLSILTGDILFRFLTLAETGSQMSALSEFRRWVRSAGKRQ